MLLVFAIIASLVSVVTSSFPIITLGYYKDCVPHQAFNRVRADSVHTDSGVAPSASESPRTITKSTKTIKEKKNSYTAITQQKWAVVWFGVGTGLGLVCQQVIMASFDDPTNLKVCMLCCGAFYIMGGIYTLYYVPETVNPGVRVASSLRDYFSKGLWRQDCQFVGNLKKVLNQSASLRVYALWFVLEQCGQSLHTLVLAQYILYRFGMGSAFLGSMGAISFLSGIVSLLCAERVIEICGQLALTLLPVILGDGLGLGLGLVGTFLYSANNKGIFVLLYPCVMLFIIPGVIVNASFQQRLAGYEMQATTRGALQGLGQLVDFFCRIPAMLLFQYAMDTSDVLDLTRDSDCETDGFKDNRTDAWLQEYCPDIPPLVESQGNVFDPLAINFMLSGIFHILAFLTWVVLLCKYNPLRASEERSKLEIQKWKQQQDDIKNDFAEKGAPEVGARYNSKPSIRSAESIEMSGVSLSSSHK